MDKVCFIDRINPFKYSVDFSSFEDQSILFPHDQLFSYVTCRFTWRTGVKEKRPVAVGGGDEPRGQTARKGGGRRCVT